MWVNENKNVWRVVIVLLVLATFTGPWFYERLSVPREFGCTPPNFQMEGDFCGSPIPGFWIFSMYGGLPAFLVSLVTEVRPWSQALREFSLVVLLFLPVVPLFSSLFFILRPHRRNVFQVVAWGLAFGISVWIVIIGREAPFGTLWGVWLYAALAVVALVLEILLLRGDRSQTLEPEPAP
jgi:hypothetical protein